MKMNMMIFAFAMIATTVWANEKYLQAMQKNIQQVYSAKTPVELQQAVNAFERVGEAEKDKWEPFYYASFGYIMMATREQEGSKKDLLLDNAAAVLKKALAINSNESEIVALEGFIHMLRVAVDPASRGQQYSGLAMQAFGKALGMNPENPRALALMAQMEFGTAQFFGSSVEGPCNTVSKAIEKFETYKSDSPLAPQWGQEMATRLKSQCK